MPKVWVRLPRSHINSKHIYVQTLSIRALSYKFCKGRILWTAGTRTCTREFIYALLSRYAQEVASNPSVKHNPFPHHRVTLLLSRDTEHQQVTHTHVCYIGERARERLSLCDANTAANPVRVCVYSVHENKCALVNIGSVRTYLSLTLWEGGIPKEREREFSCPDRKER